LGQPLWRVALTDRSAMPSMSRRPSPANTAVTNRIGVHVQLHTLGGA